MIDQDLSTWLLSNAPSAIVSGNVYPVRLPEKTGLGCYPAITFQQIAGGMPLNMDGPASPEWVTMQIDCWSIVSEEEAKSVARTMTQPAAAGGLHGFRGMMGATRVQKAAVDNGSIRSEYSEPAHADDVGLYRIGFDLQIVFES
jgi:hypothetical protein